MGRYSDEYVEGLQKDIEMLEELNRLNEDHIETLREHISFLEGEFGSDIPSVMRAAEDDDPEPDESFYTDADYRPGSLRFNLHRDGNMEIIAPEYKERFKGLKVDITPHKGFSVDVLTEEVPRKLKHKRK